MCSTCVRARCECELSTRLRAGDGRKTGKPTSWPAAAAAESLKIGWSAGRDARATDSLARTPSLCPSPLSSFHPSRDPTDEALSP